jgi:flagellar biosynthesis protein FlhG
MTGRVIAVASGKGGVGKTVLAIGLAQALAELGRRTLLIDADLGLANVDVQLGLPAGPDLGMVLAGKLALGAALQDHPGGFAVLPGRSGSGALAGLGAETMSAVLDTARGEFDITLLDIGAGVQAAQRRLVAMVDLALIIATEEPTSLTDAYAVLKLLRRDRPDSDARIIANMAGAAAGLRVWEVLDGAARNFLGAPVPFLGAVRRDAKVADTIRHQQPLLLRHPGSPAANDIRALAAQLRF